MISWAVFVSGQGTNLQHVLELERDHLKKNKVNLILADRPCVALERAQKFQKPILLWNPKALHAEDQMFEALRAHKIDAIFLLGYMRILKPSFLSRWKGPLVNLHPSLLPKYKGAHAIRDAFEAKEPILGVSLHKVVQEVDGGSILRQMEFARDPSWSLEETTNQVHSYERKIVGDFLMDLEENPSIVQDYEE
jgi:phosphoribosylglycinamide formyltransferase-1